jgi:hypothetical protein
MGVRVPEDRLRLVARIYADAVRQGVSPNKLIRSELAVPPATASRWMAAAQRAGFLHPVSTGKPGEISLSALRVANALGLPYQRLVDAVREHADGDLRI